jgi:hypothetical protein
LPTAHFEFTVAITADGPTILTPWHDSSERGGSEEGWPAEAGPSLAEPISQGAAGGR